MVPNCAAHHKWFITSVSKSVKIPTEDMIWVPGCHWLISVSILCKQLFQQNWSEYVRLYQQSYNENKEK